MGYAVTSNMSTSSRMNWDHDNWNQWLFCGHFEGSLNLFEVADALSNIVLEKSLKEKNHHETKKVRCLVTFVPTVISPGIFHPPLFITLFSILREAEREDNEEITAKQGNTWEKVSWQLASLKGDSTMNHGGQWYLKNKQTNKKKRAKLDAINHSLVPQFLLVMPSCIHDRPRSNRTA